MSRGETFSGQFCNPITDIVVTRQDKDAPLAFKGVVDGKNGVAAVAVIREVWGI